MRKNIMLIIAILLLYSCNNNCKEDAAFKEKFFKNLSIIKEYIDYQDSISTLDFEDRPLSNKRINKIENDVLDGIHFNYAVTDISLGQPGYTNVDSIIVLWKDWYEQNKCNMTMQIADSLYFYNWEAFDAAVNLFFVKRINVGLGNDEEYFDFLLDSIRKVGRERFFAE
jgi:hypothetical protein